MKRICLALLISLVLVEITAGPPCTGTNIPVGCTPAAATGPPSKITSNVKKANRRTPMEILKDIQENKDDKANWIIFQKEDNNNPVSSKENPKELA
jgi:hypothetical protein